MGAQQTHTQAPHSTCLRQRVLGSDEYILENEGVNILSDGHFLRPIPKLSKVSHFKRQILKPNLHSHLHVSFADAMRSL